jgi:histone H3/H4
MKQALITFEEAMEAYMVEAFNMSATLARQGGREQLEQSDMCLALNIAKMVKGGFSRPAIQEMQYLIKKCCAKVREEKKRGVKFAGHNNVKDAIESHPAMIRQNYTARCLHCQNGTT